MNNLLFSIAAFSENMVKTLSNSLGVWYLIILNGFGVIAIICKIFEYQVVKRDTMFVLSTVANFCWVLYFAMYGNFASTLTCAINVIKLLIFMQRGKHAWAESVWWLIGFLVLQVFVTVFTVRAWYDVFSVTAGFLGILAYFVVNQKKYRALSFVHMAVWVANSIVNFYPIALISDSMSTVSCGIAIWRYDLSKKSRLDKKTEENKEEISENNN